MIRPQNSNSKQSMRESKTCRNCCISFWLKWTYRSWWHQLLLGEDAFNLLCPAMWVLSFIVLKGKKLDSFFYSNQILSFIQDAIWLEESIRLCCSNVVGSGIGLRFDCNIGSERCLLHRVVLVFIRILNSFAPTLSRKATNAITIAGTSNAADDTALKQSFCELVQFYSDVKELSSILSAFQKRKKQNSSKISIFHCFTYLFLDSSWNSIAPLNAYLSLSFYLYWSTLQLRYWYLKKNQLSIDY